MSAPRIIDDHAVEQLIAMRARGDSWEAVARVLGVSRTSVQRLVARRPHVAARIESATAEARRAERASRKATAAATRTMHGQTPDMAPEHRSPAAQREAEADERRRQAIRHGMQDSRPGGSGATAGGSSGRRRPTGGTTRILSGYGATASLGHSRLDYEDWLTHHEHERALGPTFECRLRDASGIETDYRVVGREQAQTLVAAGWEMIST